MTTDAKPTRGGPRKGAGRKPFKNLKVFTMKMSGEDFDRWTRSAQADNKTLSAWVRERCQ